MGNDKGFSPVASGVERRKTVLNGLIRDGKAVETAGLRFVPALTDLRPTTKNTNAGSSSEAILSVAFSPRARRRLARSPERVRPESGCHSLSRPSNGNWHP
jgi:hypothetical protein